MDTDLNKKIKNILILGGAGFIGSNLAKFFVAKNKNVIIFDQENANFDKINDILDQVKIYKGDINKIEDINQIFNDHKIDLVLHLASSVIPSTPPSEETKEHELRSTTNIINLMHEKEIDRFIYFSSGGVIYGKNGKEINKENDPTCPINFYGQLKLVIEKSIQKSNKVKYIIIRPSNLYGTNQSLHGNQGIIPVTIGKIINKEVIEIWGDGEIVRDFLHIDDLCHAIYSIINGKWNEIYNVSSGKGTSINKVLETIKKVTKINFKSIYKENRNVDIPKNILDYSKIRETTNWRPMVNLETGISKFWKSINKK